MNHRISRLILLVHIIISAVVSIYLWLTVQTSLKTADIEPSGPSTGIQTLVPYLMNPYVLIFLLLTGAVIGTAVTAKNIVGAAHRIEEWLLCWLGGQSLSPLKSREGDIYSHLISLINALYRNIEDKKKLGLSK